MYDVKPKKQIIIPPFMEEWRLFVTFVPKGREEELYIESDEYLNDEIVFESHSKEEDEMFFDSIIQSS